MRHSFCRCRENGGARSDLEDNLGTVGLDIAPRPGSRAAAPKNPPLVVLMMRVALIERHPDNTRESHLRPRR